MADTNTDANAHGTSSAEQGTNPPPMIRDDSGHQESMASSESHVVKAPGKNALTPSAPKPHSNMLYSMYHRFKTNWILQRSNILVATFVYALQIVLWAIYLYYLGTDATIRNGLGWGAIIAKGAAGASYPVTFFLILSMSKWTITFLRSSPFLARAIQFDNFHWFHIHMAVTAFILAWIHGLGHLSGTYVHASRPENNALVVKIFGPSFENATYADFIKTLPGITGIILLFTFSVVAIGSMPSVKRWRFEAFQYTHWLIYPYLIVLSFHGAARELAFPIMPFVIAIPFILLVLEKMFRLCSILGRQHLYISNPDDDIMHLSIKMGMMSSWWPYRVGQYILVRQPSLSGFQWHPFTVVHREHGKIDLNVKKAGQWTNNLAKLAAETDGPLIVNVEGPYGAPTQSFYDFDHSIVIATGIGVTPSSAVLNHLATDREHPWSRSPESKGSRDPSALEQGCARTPRFADFVWSVPDQDLLEWFARSYTSAVEAEHNHNVEIGLRIFVTKISQEELARDRDQLDSAFPIDADLEIQAGRPDYAQLFAEHYANLKQMGETCGQTKKRQRIGVFFCGNKSVGDELRRICYQNTLRSVAEGTNIEYHYHPEVFG